MENYNYLHILVISFFPIIIIMSNMKNNNYPLNTNRTKKFLKFNAEFEEFFILSPR